MALIICPECGKQFSEHANACPECGVPTKEIRRLIKEQKEREIAERERLRKEQEAKEIEEAEEARIRAEKRAEWWKKNGKKVWITIIIVFFSIATVIAAKFIYEDVQTKRAIAGAEAYIAAGDSCVAIYHFDEAIKFYDKAKAVTQDKQIRSTIASRHGAIKKAKEAANREYRDALKRLRILLDADDNKFNQYSDECLDKMIAIYPDRKETIYYQNIRGK